MPDLSSTSQSVSVRPLAPVFGSIGPSGPWLHSLTVNESDREWDRRMASRLAVGDDAALAAIYDRHARHVYGIAAAMVEASAVADVVQVVFVDLWRRPDRYDPARGSLKTFLSVVTRRRAVDHLRRRSRAEARELKVGRNRPDPPPTPDETAAERLEAESVRRAMKTLPVEQRQALELAYFGGLTYRQVATSLSIPEGTAKSRLRRGLARMASVLDGEVHHE